MSRFMSPRLAALAPYTPGEQPRGGSFIKLNTNENPYPPSPRVRAALDGAPETLRLYSDPEALALRQAASAVYGLAPERIMATNGSDEALAFCFQAFCAHGAAFPDVTYGFYPVWAALYGAAAEVIPLREDFSLSTEDYRDARGTLFIANPNAPTGLTLSTGDIEALLNQNRDRLVVVDEAYADFSGVSALPLLDKYDNLLVVRTFSKSYSLAGARLGLALGPEELIADLQRVRNSFNPYNVGIPAALAGVAALEDRAYFEEGLRLVAAARRELTAGLRALGFTVPESGANFVLAGAHPAVSGEEFYKGLRRRGILVRWFSGERTRDFVRITVGTESQCAALIVAAAEIIGEASR